VVGFGRGEVHRCCGSRKAILLRVNMVAGHVRCGEARAEMRECWLGRLAARTGLVVVVVAVSVLPCLKCRPENGGELLVVCRWCSLLVVEKMLFNYLDSPSLSTLSSRYCGKVAFTRSNSVNQSH
jgi:hypothetical protein